MINDYRPDSMCIAEFWVVEPTEGTYCCEYCKHTWDDEIQVDWSASPPIAHEYAPCPKCDRESVLTLEPDIYVDAI